MANTILAYNPSVGGSGTGYSAYSGASNFAVAGSGWNPGSGSFAWWMSPDYDNTTRGIIGGLVSGEAQPVGPWTWIFSTGTTAGTTGANSIGTDQGRFDGAVTSIFISTTTYQGHNNRPGANLASLSSPCVIEIDRVGPARTFSARYRITSVSLSGSVYTISVLYVSGTGGSPSPGDNISITVLESGGTPTPESSRSRGTMQFWEVRPLNNTNAAAMAISLGIPGVTITSTQAQIRTAAQATSGFWVSW